jgi:hypothetical protein
MRLPEFPQAHSSESRGTLQEGHQKMSLLPGEKVLSDFCIDPVAVGGTGI